MTQLTTREWEVLSTYLDNQISDHDRKILEARLKNEPKLALGLEELGSTCVVLRNSPKYRVPRNFILTPQMVGNKSADRSAFSLFPTLRLTAVLATLFLVIITSGNYYFHFVGNGPILVSDAQSNNSESFPKFGKGGGGGGGVVPAPMVMPTQDALLLKSDDSQGFQAESALVVTPEVEVESSAPEDQVQALLAPNEPEVGIAQAEVEPVANDSNPQIEPQETNRFFLSWMNVLQALLASLALGSGIAAFHIRRKQVD